MLPKSFNAYGLLPPGDYGATIGELRKSILVKGPADKRAAWDAEWRLQLVDNLEVLVRQLWKAGIDRIFINGSFVEDKDHPNDIDGYFECDLMDVATGRLHRELNLLDPHKIWTWDPAGRRVHSHSCKNELPMWHVYRIELYPHFDQDAGIKDKFGHSLTFPSAFRQSRQEGRQKGIVQIKKSKLRRLR